VDGITIHASVGGIDDSGNILLNGTNQDGSSFYLAMWDGSAAHLIMTPGQKMPDGRQISSLSTVKACADGFVAGILGTTARFRNGAWDYLVDPSQPLATGAPANTLSVRDANRPCDTVFLDGFGTGGIGAFAGSKYQEIQDLQQLTPDGDLLSVSQMLINDDATIYVLGANDQGKKSSTGARPSNSGAGFAQDRLEPSEVSRVLIHCIRTCPLSSLLQLRRRVFRWGS
jgi:hypothetical protein